MNDALRFAQGKLATKFSIVAEAGHIKKLMIQITVKL
jgi:hypothetical protein